MTPTTALGLSIRLSMFKLRETGDWVIFLGPSERARVETGGADQWLLKRRNCSGFARVNKVASASLGYPLSVFNKNSTLRCATKNVVLSCNKKSGKSGSVAPKCKMAENLLRIDRHRPKIGLNPNFLGHSHSP